MPATIYQPIAFTPLTGIFDARSSADEKPPGSFAWKENFAINSDGKLARAKGWRRFGDILCPRNADWHDQGVTAAAREPITLLFPSTENDGTRRLFAATKTRIILLDETSGDWDTLVDTGAGYGADGADSLTQLRFNAAELQNKVFFTNDFDDPFYIDLANPLGGAQVITDLALAGEDIDGNPVAITKVKRVISWNGVILYMNLVEGGFRFASRIRWSDLNDGTLLRVGVPPTSIADFQDLDYGHEILNAVPIGTALYVFTDRSIWRTNFTVDTLNNTAALDAVRVYYEPRNQAKCLAYPNSLISDGDTAWYGGRDGIYAYRPGYSTEPELREWLHRSTSIIFSGPKAIDTAACNSMIGEFHKDNNEIHFSWPVYDPPAVPVGTPDVTCDDDYVSSPPIPGTGINIHTLVANTKYQTADYRNYGSTALANFRSDIGGGECNQASKLIAVNGSDWTVKELNYGNAREMFSLTGEAYTQTGYFSILRGVFPFARFDSEKELAKFLAAVTPDDPVDTAVLRLRIGTSDIALDPNGANGNCAVLFRQLSNKAIRCHYKKTAAQYLAENQRPDDTPVMWNFFYLGRFLYYELTVAAPDNSAPTTGGLTITRFEVDARLL